MNLSSSSLYDIPDLSALTVKSLDLRHNCLTELPVENLPRGLERLNVSENYIGSHGLPQSLPNTLNSLNLSYCRIRSLRPIQQFPPNLNYLDISHMLLEDFDGFQCDSIEHLCMEKNSVKILTNLPKSLQKLNAWGNSIRLLPTRLPLSLRILNLNNNCLTRQALPRHWGNCLEELYLNTNELDTIPKNLPPTLNTLHLRNNKITDIPEGLPPHLDVLILCDNPLHSVAITPRKHPMRLVDVSNTSLTWSISTRPGSFNWATIIIQEHTFDKQIHDTSVKRIQKNWRIYRMRNRLKQWKRTALVKDELFQVSMMPERVWQTDVISSEWRRPIFN